MATYPLAASCDSRGVKPSEAEIVTVEVLVTVVVVEVELYRTHQQSRNDSSMAILTA